MAKMMVNGSELVVGVSCSLGGIVNLLSNVIHIEIQVICKSGHCPPMSLAFNQRRNVKQLSRKDNTVVYEVKALHKIRECLILTVGFDCSASNKRVENSFSLGVPGIAGAKLYSDVFEPPKRAKNVDLQI